MTRYSKLSRFVCEYNGFEDDYISLHGSKVLLESIKKGLSGVL